MKFNDWHKMKESFSQLGNHRENIQHLKDLLTMAERYLKNFKELTSRRKVQLFALGRELAKYGYDFIPKSDEELATSAWKGELESAVDELNYKLEKRTPGSDRLRRFRAMTRHPERPASDFDNYPDVSPFRV